jgi:polyisoprenoid-binding protein YceI
MKPLLLVPVAILAAAGSATAQTSQQAKDAPLTYIVAPTGNEARYRVREQLVGVDLPNDAVGATQDIKGRIQLKSDGKVVKEGSKIVVGLTSLKSDKRRRDNYIHTRTLETAKFPQVELVPASLEGLLLPIPPGASRTFSLVGDLTVRGVTHPTTWHVTARSDDKGVVGSAVTAFTFKDFGMEQPKVSVVLSVADTIKLEYDFRFVPDTLK